MNKALLEWLAAPGRTQRALAQALGVREATVSAWVRGVQPRPAQMQRVAEVTEGCVPVQSWFGASDPVHRSPAPLAGAQR